MFFGSRAKGERPVTEDENAKVLEEEKYPTLDELRDSTAIESTNSLDLVGLKQLKQREEEEKSLPLRKKKTILEECAESILNEARNHSDGQETNEEVPEPQIVYHVKRLAELASRSARSARDDGEDDLRDGDDGVRNQENKGHHHRHQEEDKNFNGIQTNEEADIVMTVFETIAERESALLRETCAESLGLLSRAFLAVDSIYEEKLLEIAFVLLEDDDPDVVKKTEEQFSVICENITRDSIDRMLIPHVINVMFKENDEQLRISSLNVMKNILVGSGNSTTLVEHCYHGQIVLAKRIWKRWMR